MRYAQCFCVLVLCCALPACGSSRRASLESHSNAVAQRVSPAGAPVYPGAREHFVHGVARFSTVDRFDRVYAFYKRQMPLGSELLHVGEAGSSMACFRLDDEKDFEQTSVTITGKSNGTDILIRHAAFAGATETRD